MKVFLTWFLLSLAATVIQAQQLPTDQSLNPDFEHALLKHGNQSFFLGFYQDLGKRDQPVVWLDSKGLNTRSGILCHWHGSRYFLNRCNPKLPLRHVITDSGNAGPVLAIQLAARYENVIVVRYYHQLLYADLGQLRFPVQFQKSRTFKAVEKQARASQLLSQQSIKGFLTQFRRCLQTNPSACFDQYVYDGDRPLHLVASDNKSAIKSGCHNLGRDLALGDLAECALKPMWHRIASCTDTETFDHIYADEDSVLLTKGEYVCQMRRVGVDWKFDLIWPASL